MDIGRGQWSSVGPKPIKVHKKRNRTIFADTGYCSLNFEARRRENRRIDKDNRNLAQRLFENDGVITKRNHDHEWARSRDYAYNITKLNKDNFASSKSTFRKSYINSAYVSGYNTSSNFNQESGPTFQTV